MAGFSRLRLRSNSMRQRVWYCHPQFTEEEIEVQRRVSVRGRFASWMCILTPAAWSLCAVGQVNLSVPWFGFLICSAGTRYLAHRVWGGFAEIKQIQVSERRRELGELKNGLAVIMVGLQGIAQMSPLLGRLRGFPRQADVFLPFSSAPAAPGLSVYSSFK